MTALDAGAADLRTQLDQVAADAWPALEQQVVAGWRLRAAAGVTRRANSALPGAVALDAAALDRQLTLVHEFYAARGLPVQVQVSDPRLDAELAARGWSRHTPTTVMAGPLPLSPERSPDRVELSAVLTDEWTQCWWAVDGRGGDRELEVALGCLAGIRAPVCYATVRDAGQVVASARAVVQQGWGGVFAIAVLPEHRCRGHGGRLLQALADWTVQAGATSAYLQVAEDNVAARQLYDAIGLSPTYGYAYRTAPTEQDPEP